MGRNQLAQRVLSDQTRLRPRDVAHVVRHRALQLLRGAHARRNWRPVHRGVLAEGRVFTAVQGQLPDCMSPLAPLLCGRIQSVVVAHDGRRMEYPTGCMRHRLSGQNPYSFHAQPPLVATHRKAFVAYYQRWQVRNVHMDASSFY